MRRPTEWHGFGYPDTVLGSSPYVINVISSSDFDSYTKPTVTRIIGDLNYRLNVSGAVEAQVSSIFVGIGVFDEDVTPDPYSEGDRAGWIWMGSGVMGAPIVQDSYDGTNRYDVQVSGYRRLQFHVDSRAQRIVGPADKLILVTNFTDEVGSPDNPALTAHLRTLVKE